MNPQPEEEESSMGKPKNEDTKMTPTYSVVKDSISPYLLKAVCQHG